MRCSSCESQLAPLVDGSLGDSQRTALDAHLATCAACTELLTELRVVDALFASPAAADLAPNFSFRVMAEVRSQPRPHRHRTPLLPVIGAYLAVAWLALGAFFLAGGGLARQAVASLERSAAQTGEVFAAVTAATQRLCDHDAFGVGFAMTGILALDALATIAAIRAFAAYRNRSVRALARERFER